MTGTTATPAWLDGARVAPSAHNTQPWRFTPLPDGRIAVRWRPERALPVTDPTGRDLYLALGAAVESALLRSSAAGAPLAFAPAADDEVGTVGHLTPATTPHDAADLRLAAALDRRQTGRAPHLPRPLPPGVLARLRDEAARDGCALHPTTDRRTIGSLAALARRATAAGFADRTGHAELWGWLRLDPTVAAYRRDGLTADCLNLHGAALAVARLAMPPAHMRLLARLGLHHLLALDTQLTVRRSAALCLLTAPSAARADLVAAGRVLQRLWLIAADAGLTTHPISALLDCAATAGPAVAHFGAAGTPPANLFRLGATPPPARAPRLPAEELLEV